MIEECRIAICAYVFGVLLAMPGFVDWCAVRERAVCKYESTVAGTRSAESIGSFPSIAVQDVGESGAPSELGDGSFQESETLRKYADKMGFVLGTSLSDGPNWTQDLPLQETLGREFNTAVSVIFMRFAEPEDGQFDLRFIDKTKEVARKYNIKLFGQTLVYRDNTAPKWLRLDQPHCGNWSIRELSRTLRNYIHTVVQYGGESYYGWEVVNEPITSGRDSCWSRVLGQDEYVAKAFRYAREAAPNATLLLNEDFGVSGVDKSLTEQFFAMVKRLKSRGVPIDAVGSEMHLEAQKLDPDYIGEFKYWLNQARETGVRSQVTEMDVYQGGEGTLPDPLTNQRAVYYNVLRVCLQDLNCTGFTTWNITDRYTWRRLRRFKGGYRPDAKPCLFDDNFLKKPAYYGVLQALKEGR